MNWTGHDIDNLKKRGIKTKSTSERTSKGEIMPPVERERAKYGNTKTEVDGIKFDSKLEARRYTELKYMQMAGEITELELQPEYEFSINAVLVCKYRADFAYIRANVRVVEDAKGVKTPEYIIKKKLMRAVYNIEIKEIYASKK